MKRLPLLILAVLCPPLLVLTAGGAPLGSNELALAKTQGSYSLTNFQALITPANFHLMGFQFVDEIVGSTNAEPLLIYTIPVKNLRNYVTGQDLNTLLDPNPLQVAPRRVIIPIMAGNQVRSSTTLLYAPDPTGGLGTWVTVNWGQPKLIRRLMSTYQVASPAVPAGNILFAVEIPLFDLWFIAYHDSQNQLILRSTTRVNLGPIAIPLHQNVTEAALERLAYEAQRYNGMPN